VQTANIGHRFTPRIDVARIARSSRASATLMYLALFIVIVLIAGGVAFGVTRAAQDHTRRAALVNHVPESSGLDTSGAVIASDGVAQHPLALVNGLPLFPLPTNLSLAQWTKDPVEIHSGTVQSVLPNGFWLGDSIEQRVLVIVPASAPIQPNFAPAALHAGEQVNVSGRLTALPDDPTTLGVSPDTGQDMLAAEQQYVTANSVRTATP
jgi:hypothetical protein